MSSGFGNSFAGSSPSQNIKNFGNGSLTFKKLFADTTDTLLLTKNGYLNKAVALRANTDILGDLRLYDTSFVLLPDNFPKIDGSTTNIPLARIICCKLMNSSYAWKPVKPVYPISYNFEVIPDVTDSYKSTSIMKLSTFSKTPQSYDSLIAGSRDLILVASAPSLAHLASARAKGIAFDVRQFATDALLMIVGINTQVSSVTSQNVKDIYTGTITNWQQVGGPNLTIVPLQREEGSGSQELMKSLVMKETLINQNVDILRGMMTVFDELHYRIGAISYTPYYYKEFQMRDTLIKSIAINGIVPNRESLYSGTYPYCAPVYVVTRTNLSDTTKAAKLGDWLISPYGQRVVEESGYVRK